MWRLASLCFALLFAGAASAQVPSDSRLKTIVAKKTIRIAARTDATPFAFRNDKKEPTGYSLELCALVAQSIAQQYGLTELRVEWIPATVQTRFSVVTDGKADMECGASTVTLSRMKQVDFSNVTFVESTGVVVTKASNIRSFADLAGKKIAVLAGSSNEQAVAHLIAQRKLDLTLVPVKDRDEGISALELGSVQGYASDKLLLVGAQFKTPDAFLMLPEDLSIEPYAIVLPRGDWALRQAVNTGISRVFRGGQNVELFKRWFEPIGLKPGLLLGAVYTLGGLAD